MTSSPVEPDDARRAAEEILARPEYQEPEPSLLDRIFDAIGDLLGRTFDALGSGAGGLIGTVVVLAVLALAGWLLWRALRVGGRTGRAAVDVGVVHGTEAPDDPDVWAAEAVRLAAAGDHRGALRCRYQELVARLVHDRLVPADPSRTPDELRHALAAARPDLAADLADVTDRFEAVWYGGAGVDEPGYQAFTATAARLVRSARAVPA